MIWEAYTAISTGLRYLIRTLKLNQQPHWSNRICYAQYYPAMQLTLSRLLI